MLSRRAKITENSISPSGYVCCRHRAGFYHLDQSSRQRKPWSYRSHRIVRPGQMMGRTGLEAVIAAKLVRRSSDRAGRSVFAAIIDYGSLGVGQAIATRPRHLEE